MICSFLFFNRFSPRSIILFISIPSFSKYQASFKKTYKFLFFPHVSTDSRLSINNRFLFIFHSFFSKISSATPSTESQTRISFLPPSSSTFKQSRRILASTIPDLIAPRIYRIHSNISLEHCSTKLGAKRTPGWSHRKSNPDFDNSF